MMTRNSTGWSTTIAVSSDIFFNPLTKTGKLYLNQRSKIFQRDRVKFTRAYGITEEISEEEDVRYLESLNPVEWKEQDLYAIIGLKNQRFRATDDDIRKAYRQRCLKHHPDKRMAAGQFIPNPDGDYFACIVQAFDVLGTPLKRKSYDSIDPTFDDYFPSTKNIDESNFYQVYGKWFELNSRWSNTQPVPLLGNPYCSRSYVESFYDFWYSFDSWREYSWLDEEDKEKGQFREERRWIEKQNKVVRAKRKKEEMSRIRQVVDNAYASDPRIANFKREDSQRKEDAKQARRDLAKQKQLEEDKLRQEAEDKARAQREAEEAEARERDLANKKEKDALKKALKKERKNLRTTCKNHNYFASDQTSSLRVMEDVERLCELLTLSELEGLNNQLANLNIHDSELAFKDCVSKLNQRIQFEKAETQKLVNARNGTSDGSGGGDSAWSHEELSMLIKTVNLFPAGTNQRWEVVANFLHQHGNNFKKRTAKEVLTKAKDLKTSDYSKDILKKETNEHAFDLFKKGVKAVPAESDASQRFEVNGNGTSATAATVVNGKGSTASKSKSNTSVGSTDLPPSSSDPLPQEPPQAQPEKSWSPADQKLLEQALKTYPPSDPERWTHIASCVPGRTKKECMTRYKELAALVKAKKSAQQGLQKT